MVDAEEEQQIEVAERSQARGIPERLVRLISPAVLEDRERNLDSRAADVGRRRLLRERCHEITAKKLLETLYAA